MDPLTRVTHDKDTSFAFIRAAQARGHESFHCLPQDLHVREGRTLASVQRLEVLTEPPYIVLHKDRTHEASRASRHRCGVYPERPSVRPSVSLCDVDEDCMRINVWTPGINDGKKRPVMFWIHGGGFTAGSSIELPSYDGENLAKKGDVVVVSINHRLNILGYLDLSAYGDKYKQSANLSVLDMKAALEWVKTNISNFGGDPNNVTIFGQSGGGAKVNTLMAMPSAKGLFHKAINQSGAFRSAMLDKVTTQAIGAEVVKELRTWRQSGRDTKRALPNFSKCWEKSSKNRCRQNESRRQTSHRFWIKLGTKCGWRSTSLPIILERGF